MIYKIFSAPNPENLEEQLSSQENNKYELLGGICYAKGQFHQACILKGYAEECLKKQESQKEEKKELNA